MPKDEKYKMIMYANLIRQIIPLDDDLEYLGAPSEAINMIQDISQICRNDFQEKYGVSHSSVSLNGDLIK